MVLFGLILSIAITFALVYLNKIPRGYLDFRDQIVRKFMFAVVK